MYIFNISFVVSAARKNSFIRWANSEGRRAAASDSLQSFRILTVAAVPGDPDFTNSPDRNFSIQLGFGSLSSCRDWNEKLFPDLIASYTSWHGPDPVFFATILKEV